MKKKGIFAATAMLMVAIIAAVGATYAWFTTVSSATSTISMGVQDGSSLEISSDNSNWASSYTYEGNSIWKDSSIGGDLTTFYRPVFQDGTTTISSYEQDTVASVVLYFRSTSSSDITMSGNIAAVDFTTEQGDLIKWAQILVDDGNDTANAKANAVYSNTSQTANNTIVGEQTSNNNGTYTTKALSATNAIIKMSETANDDGYYTGSATFYFFIEGTQTDNGDINGIGENAQIKATLTFAQ